MISAPAPNYQEQYRRAKGISNFGGMNITYDFTDGLNEKDWIRKMTFRNKDYFVCENGKIIMPNLGIY